MVLNVSLLAMEYCKPQETQTNTCSSILETSDPALLSAFTSCPSSHLPLNPLTLVSLSLTPSSVKETNLIILF